MDSDSSDAESSDSGVTVDSGPPDFARRPLLNDERAPGCHFGGDEGDDANEGEEEESEDEPEPENTTFDREEDDPKEADESASHLQLNVMVFGCSSIQKSIRRIWDVLPKEDDALTFNGYVEIHMRIQKCLTPDFNQEEAKALAFGDWSDDVEEGRTVMNAPQFAMFLFELCCMWSGPKVSLSAHLLFLNAVFIGVTEVGTSRTVSVRALESVDSFPKSFFSLLSAEGWSGAETGSSVDEEEVLRAWMSRNVSREAEQDAMLKVQRQVFQITQDARSVLLFRDEGDVLDRVRVASHILSKVVTDPNMFLLDKKVMDSRTPRPNGSHYARFQGPTCEHRTRDPQLDLEADFAKVLVRRTSRPSCRELESDRDAFISSPPRGRAFETRRVHRRGLVLAGRAALRRETAIREAVTSETPRVDVTADTFDSVDAFLHGASGPTDSLSRSFFAAGERPPSSLCDRPKSVDTGTLEGKAHPRDPVHRVSHAAEQRHAEDPLLEAPSSNTYRLPSRPRGLYQNKVDPVIGKTPQVIGFEAKRSQWLLAKSRAARHDVDFERVLSLLPEKLQPVEEVRTPRGPLGHPSEPVWFEMGHRLHQILKKQGKRAERRKKRRIRLKLSGLTTRKPDAGRDLRSFLDADQAGGSTFIDRVEENFFKDSFRVKVQERFLVPGAVSTKPGVPSVGEIHSPRRRPRVVRPVRVHLDTSECRCWCKFSEAMQ